MISILLFLPSILQQRSLRSLSKIQFGLKAVLTFFGSFFNFNSSRFFLARAVQESQAVSVERQMRDLLLPPERTVCSGCDPLAKRISGSLSYLDCNSLDFGFFDLESHVFDFIDLIESITKLITARARRRDRAGRLGQYRCCAASTQRQQ